jgi:hypothetical protein
MRRVITTLLLAATGFILDCRAQETKLANPFVAFRKGIVEHNLLDAIQAFKRDSSQYMTSPMKKMYLELFAQLYIYAGDLDMADQIEEAFLAASPGLTKKADPTTNKSTNKLAGYKGVDAAKEIVDVGKTKQIIIINEEHRASAHRALTYSVLSGLYAHGFRYFAAETIVMKDSLLQQRGYATHDTGFYTADPVFANVVREAIRIGYTIVPYEYEEHCDEENADVCQEKREQGQAQNIYNRILKNDPSAKILMHVGRTHAAKISLPGQYSFMAWHLRNISGIEPFSVEQVFHNPFPNRDRESDLYKEAHEKHLMLPVATAMISADGKYFARDGYDMEVFTPRPVTKNGRQTWLTLRNKRKEHAIRLEALGLTSNKKLFANVEPVTIEALGENESDDAIPVDQIILWPNKSIPVLLLPSGNFRIQARSSSGRVTAKYIVNVQ